MSQRDIADDNHPSRQPRTTENDALKESHRRFRFILDRGIAHILDSEDSELAAWQVAFALGSPACMGITMVQKAQELGVGKAAISKGATAFCRAVDIEPSQYMLSKKAQSSYRTFRNEQEEQRK